MAREIERKFLVANEGWRDAVTGNGRAIKQFYLAVFEDRTVRVRITDSGTAKLTIKTGTGIERGEFEYEIPLEDAAALRGSALGRVISKRRFEAPLGDLTVEIDVFDGDLDGLVYAEIELPSADTRIDLPDYIGTEVTDDPAYTNARLAIDGRPRRDRR